jgi:hypothetical protein
VKILQAGLMAAAILAAAGAAQAQVSAGIHAGTAGFGPDLQYHLNDNFTVRGAADWLNFSYGRDYNGVHYDGRLKLATGGAFLDWHPWGNAFFVSGGAYFGDRRVDLSAVPSTNVTLGGVSFTPAQVGRLDGRIKMDSTAPFAGLGFDTNNRAAARGLGFKGVLGVAFSGRPKVNLTSSGGLLSNTALLQPELLLEQQRIAHDARYLGTYPVAQIGLTYRF